MKLQDVKRWIDAELSRIITAPEEVATQRNLLIQHVLGVSMVDLFRDPHQEAPEGLKMLALKEILEKRVKDRMPLQFLLGTAHFYGLEFKVKPGVVLIPRPETELLVEQALKLCRERKYRNVVDLGTGSGCIAVALKKQMPSLSVSATDVSAKALEVAWENASAHDTEIHFKRGSWFEPLEGERFDLIVSNPPYIHRQEQKGLEPELSHEPDQALYTPEEPEKLYQFLIAGARKHLNPDGAFLFEMGAGQGKILEALARQNGFTPHILLDYAGIDRILRGDR